MAEGGGPRIAVLAPMATELRPVVRAGHLERRAAIGGHDAYAGRLGRADVIAVRIGVGTTAAMAVTTDVLTAHAVDHVVVVGIAGAVGPSHPLGDRIAPALVVDAASGVGFRPHPLGDTALTPSGTLQTGDELIRDPDRLARLERDGVVALDMETAAVAAVCDERGLPWSVERAISDLAGDDAIDEVVGSALLRADGTPNLRAVAGYTVRDPRRIRHLARLGGQSQRASRVAAEAAVTAIRRLD